MMFKRWENYIMKQGEQKKHIDKRKKEILEKINEKRQAHKEVADKIAQHKKT